MLAPTQVITISVTSISELALRLAGRESVPVRAVDGVRGEDEPLGGRDSKFHAIYSLLPKSDASSTTPCSSASFTSSLSMREEGTDRPVAQWLTAALVQPRRLEISARDMPALLRRLIAFCVVMGRI